MESGNSSSMQSSSGGDDQEFESSGGVLGGSSANYFTTSNVNNTTATTQPFNNPSMFMLSSAQQLPVVTPPLSLQHQHQASSYLDVFQNQANYQNLMFWQQQQQQQHFGGSGSGSGGLGLSDHPSVNNPSCTVNTTHLSALGNSPRPSTSQHTGGGSGGASASSSGGVGAGATGGVGKNPRKRTRASRRAPTTVLTTDTSNFRAMVQEFTGIPSSPFSAAASPLLSRRLTDLLSSSPGPTLRPGPPPPLVGPSSTSLERLLSGYNSSFPLRPSAHKLNSTSTDSTQQNIHAASNTANTFTPLGNLSIQSLLQPNSAPSSLRYPGSVASAAGLLTPSVGNFQDLSGVIGSDPVFGFAPMRLAPDSGDWRGGSSGGGGGVGSNEEGGDHGEGNNNNNNNNNNIGADRNNNNNDNNQQMEGSISGGGTSNYNVNMNCSRDKGLDSNTSNRGGAQGLLLAAL